MLYSMASVAGADPARFVATVTGVPRSTVGRWVMKARAAGLLNPWESE